MYKLIFHQFVLFRPSSSNAKILYFLGNNRRLGLYEELFPECVGLLIPWSVHKLFDTSSNKINKTFIVNCKKIISLSLPMHFCVLLYRKHVLEPLSHKSVIWFIIILLYPRNILPYSSFQQIIQQNECYFKRSNKLDVLFCRLKRYVTAN